MKKMRNFDEEFTGMPKGWSAIVVQVASINIYLVKIKHLIPQVNFESEQLIKN